MHWELWALNAGNLIRDFESEDEARAVVCGLLADGWQPADLGVVLEWDDGEEGDDAPLPPAMSGATLAAWAVEGRANARLSA